MKPGNWIELSSGLHADCRIFTVNKSRRKSTLSGLEHDFYTIHGYDWVNVIPVTKENEVVLVRQYRHGIKEFTLELPGGAIHPDEDPVTGGLRELEEETGFLAEKSLILAKTYPNPAIQSNTCYYVLAENCTLTGKQHLDPAEEIEIVRVPASSIKEMIERNEFNHALVLNGLFFWLNHLKLTTASNHE